MHIDKESERLLVEHIRSTIEPYTIWLAIYEDNKEPQVTFQLDERFDNDVELNIYGTAYIRLTTTQQIADRYDGLTTEILDAIIKTEIATYLDINRGNTGISLSTLLRLINNKNCTDANKVLGLKYILTDDTLVLTKANIQVEIDLKANIARTTVSTQDRYLAIDDFKQVKVKPKLSSILTTHTRG